MEEQLKIRLKELHAEFAAGEQKLQELNEQENSLRNALLRMSGAIQVLQEELSENNGKNAGSVSSTKTKQQTVAEVETTESV